MKIILLKDVKGLGNQYDIVTVKNGYGRNYLIPQKLAVIANKPNTARIKELVRQINHKQVKALAAITTLVERVKLKPIRVGAKTGTTEKIFGSVTNIQLAEAIRKQAGVDIDRRKITILEEVKTLGTYKALIHFREDVKEEIEFEVFSE